MNEEEIEIEEEREINPGTHGWKCLICDWEQFNQYPEPPFTEKLCGCCYDFECPKCGCAVETIYR